MTSSGDMRPFLIEGTASDHFQSLREHYLEVISWYLKEKEKKGRLSKSLRLASIVLAVLGGAAPLVADIAPVNPSSGYVLLALAAGLQLVDRFFGYSSAWSRYVSSAMDLNAHLLLFQLDYSRLEATSAPDEERWALLRRAAQQLAEAVSSETRTWSTEFAQNLQELDRTQPGGER